MRARGCPCICYSHAFHDPHARNASQRFARRARLNKTHAHAHRAQTNRQVCEDAFFVVPAPARAGSSSGTSASSTSEAGASGQPAADSQHEKGAGAGAGGLVLGVLDGVGGSRTRGDKGSVAAFVAALAANVATAIEADAPVWDAEQLRVRGGWCIERGAATKPLRAFI